MKGKPGVSATPKQGVLLPYSRYEILRGAICETEDARVRYYNPFDFYYLQPEKHAGIKSLYLKFASLRETEEAAVLDFINKYGLPSLYVATPPLAYPIRIFQEEVREMRALVSLWQALQKNDREGIKQYTRQAH